jgi:hypothetical protein
LSKGASVPRACLRAVRSAKEPAALAGWEGPMRTNSRVSGRVMAVLIVGFYWVNLAKGAGVVLVVMLV